jgi:hypothetical protein
MPTMIILSLAIAQRGSYLRVLKYKSWENLGGPLPAKVRDRPDLSWSETITPQQARANRLHPLKDFRKS